MRENERETAAAVVETAAEGGKKLRILVALDVYLPNMDGVVDCMRNLLLD